MRELRNIEIFTEVASCQSFSKAAKNLLLTPSSVSMSVQKLESALGARLFTRTTRQLHLTVDGQAFLDHAQQGLSKIYEAIDLFSNRSGPLTGPLRVSVMSSIGRKFLMPALPEFLAEHPGISVEMSLDDHLPDMIKDRIDLALCCGEPEKDSYVARYLCSPVLALVASPSYVSKHGLPHHPNDLEEHKAIAVCLRDAPAPQWTIRERLSLASSEQVSVTFEPNSSLNIIESHDCAIEAALSGVGVALVMRKAAAAHLASGSLIQLLPNYDFSTNQGDRAYLTYPSKKYLPARVRVFIDFLVDISQRDGWSTVSSGEPPFQTMPQIKIA
jgi:LysR family transcriptional regulator for bpeEF and oprC